MPHVLQEHFKGVVGQYDGPDGDRFALEELAPVARRFVPANGRVLEIGCGYGRNVSALTTIGARLVVGSDPQFKELLRARARHRDLPESRRAPIAYVHQEEFRLPFADQAFDLVVLWQVMEHVFGREQKRRVIEEVVRIVKGGGHILIETPNQWFPVDYHDNRIPLAHWILPPAGRRWLTERVRGMSYPPSEYMSLFDFQRLLSRAPGVARATRATRIYFAASFRDAWRSLGGTNVSLKRLIFLLVLPVHAALSLVGLSGDVVLPSIRVVWRIDRAA